MSPKEYLAVQFHFDGKFVNDGRTLEYVGGKDAMSMILRKKCGIADIHRHLRVHHNISDREMLHWLMPRKGLFDDLGCLANDEACMVMVKHIPIDGVVDIGGATLGPNRAMARPGIWLKSNLPLCITIKNCTMAAQ
jgi:alpha-galactosidase